MDTSIEDVYNLVYLNEDIWKNKQSSGLWRNSTFCLLGFNDNLESCTNLLHKILHSLVVRGANVLKYPNKKLDVRKLTINYYLCNYSMGYVTKPPNSLDHKLVTPIWLYSCNRDNKVYLSDNPPIFRANKAFNCLKFRNSDLKLSLFGSFNDNSNDMKGNSGNSIKYSFDTLSRFIVHCGFTFVDPKKMKNKEFKVDSKLYLLFCKTFDESIDEEVINLSLVMPCLSIQWLFDSYLNGELKEIKNYMVSPQKYNVKSKPKKRKNFKRNYGNKVLCFSFGFAIEHDLHKTDLKEFGAVAAYVVNPIFVLAPWALETSDNYIKKMYNNISLVEDNRLLLFISTVESVSEGKGLFGELSMLVENCVPKLGKNLVRSIKIYNSFNTSEDNLLEIPNELLEGNKLNVFERNANVNLYDLAESITFVDIDKLSQYQEELGCSETTQELHEMIEDFSNALKESEMRWAQLTRSE